MRHLLSLSYRVSSNTKGCFVYATSPASPPYCYSPETSTVDRVVNIILYNSVTFRAIQQNWFDKAVIKSQLRPCAGSLDK